MTLRYQCAHWGLINGDVVCEVMKMKKIAERKKQRTMGRNLGNSFICGAGK